MKKSIRSTNSEEHRSGVTRSHQTSKNSHFAAGPSHASTSTSASIPSSNINPTKKHGFGFGRFSLRRIFNPSSIGRTMTSTKHRNTFKETHSESGSAYDSKSISNAKIGTYRPTCSSDAESYSISSGRSDYYHTTVPPYIDTSMCSSGVYECPLCLLEQPYSHFPEITSCAHRACHHCLQQYLRIEILESRVNIHCPECTEPLHPNDIAKILNYDVNIIEKYETFMLRRILVTEPDARWCPAPDCGYVVIATGCASCPRLKCERPGCETSFCYHCKQEWHPNQTCDNARAQRSSRHSPNNKSSSVSFSHDSIVQRDDIKPCPCCKVPIIKMDDGSCNHMTCSVCGTEFCWLCMKEISDLHYLSPSGCTFWGKKPWSRKKKIMWQLGMLVGAPVGIALIAGIAVPAIIIGIPVWVGRKLHARFERHQMSRHKRNLMVTTGVLTSIFVSPILAAVAVGIGVPILLAYVYGVVPISLCRSGGCGVTTSASGVRIELDEENEIGIGSNVAADGVSVDTALSNRGVNPSIGEFSLGMSASVSMGSGSHLDRLGAADRENASTAACAGSIASGNISIGVTHRVEFQADMSSNKRFSLCSETASATLSLGDRSANISLMDDASVKALAGSIAGYKMDKDPVNSYTNAVTPVEVHVDAGIMSLPYNTNQSQSPCCCESTINYECSNEINDYASSPNANFLDYCVTFIDESPTPCEIASSDGKHVKGEVKSKHNVIGKYESRSLEQLSNYCEICHKTHRPCCPNYVHQSNTHTPKSTLSSNNSSNNSRKSKAKSLCPDDEKRSSSKHRSHHQTSIFSKRRTSSVKSNPSNSIESDSSHKELKRVRSSEYKSPSKKGTNLTSLFRSTPSSPTETEISYDGHNNTISYDGHNNTISYDGHNNTKRAYDKIPSSKYINTQQKPMTKDAKSNFMDKTDLKTDLKPDLYTVSLKSSEV